MIDKEQLISFETAKLAKQKGFNNDNEYNETEYSFDSYYGNINIIKTESLDIELNNPNVFLCPFQSELQKWLREKYDIHIVPIVNPHSETELYGYKIYAESFRCIETVYLNVKYEIAMEKGLREALKKIE